MDKPRWTKDPPTEPGLYWFQLRVDEEPVGVTRHCRVVSDGEGHLSLGERNYDSAHYLAVENLQRWWAGPLPEPIE